MLRNTLNVILIAITLSVCASLYGSRVGDNNGPINLIPMYGHPKIEKTRSQKKADDQFIRTVLKNSGSRKNASKEFAAWGWFERRKGNTDNAMRRFNQAWLLDPNYYQPYWGFGAITLANKKPAEAVVYFEKALSLIDDDGEKPRLLVDTAKAYALQGSNAKKTDTVKSEGFYKKANSLIEKALNADPKYGNAYRFGALISYVQGNYKGAWKIVKKARTSGSYKFNPKFIAALSKKMPEPK